MYLKPCRNCPHRKGCETKAEKLKSLRGLGFTSANFKCDDRLAGLQPGQRVMIDLIEMDNRGKDWKTTHIATVMAPHGARVLVWLDEITELGHNPISVQPNRLTPTGGRVEVCPECGQPEGTDPLPDRDGRSRFHCPTCEGTSKYD